MDIDQLKSLVITEDDIRWVESILGNDFCFDHERSAVIKNLNSIDVQAFPGSGKTTTLVAKLAILANKWTSSCSGICVLSHTNVAREEIEERLGSSDVGKRLLSYPHFIGTVHSFFDTYLSLPWLRSQGIKLNMIDTDLVQKIRWNNIPKNLRYGLERKNLNEAVCSYRKAIGEIRIGTIKPHTETYKAVLSAVEKSQKNGNFTFHEILLYAQEAINNLPSLLKSIQLRFPLLFIDEAQDTNSFQQNLINQVFNPDGGVSIYQGFGDSNQAIYNYFNEDVEIISFPRNNALLISSSRRFDNRIATLANPIALSHEQMCGVDNRLSDKKCSHTIYLFSREKISLVLEAFGQLILDTFSDEDLMKYQKQGCHIIGMVHDKKEETPAKHFPKGIYDYWPCYESKKSNKNATPQILLEYFRKGKDEANKTGETSKQIEWISKGLRRLINQAKKENYIPATSNSFYAINKVLSFDNQLIFRNMIINFLNADITSKENWDLISNEVLKILVLFDTSTNNKVENFLLWANDTLISETHHQEGQKNLLNHYRYCDLLGRSVELEFGSIHSVKGRTHLATLVLETFSKAHNLKSIISYLCNKPPKSPISNQNQIRLKCQYVAMTRAMGLLCIAIPEDFVDTNMQSQLISLGWCIKHI